MKTATFSLRDFLTAEKPQTLYIVSPPLDVSVLAPITRVLFELTSRIIMEKEPVTERRRNETLSPKTENKSEFLNWPKLYKRSNIMFLLNDSLKYGKFETLERAASIIRSYGVRIVMSAQSLSRLERIYGRYSSLLSNSRCQVVFSGARA